MTLFSLTDIRVHHVLKYPAIKITKGEVTFICGESGTGKSTLLKLLNGSVSPESGTITYLDNPLENTDSILLRQEVLLISQSVYLFDESIRENFAAYYAYRDLSPPSDTEMARFLTLCCAEFPLDAVCTTLSGGERQRVYAAILLSFLPKVLLLDEPTSALDDATADRLMKNIRLFCFEKEITLIVVSHNKTLAEKYADQTITLKGKDAL